MISIICQYVLFSSNSCMKSNISRFHTIPQYKIFYTIYSTPFYTISQFFNHNFDSKIVVERFRRLLRTINGNLFAFYFNNILSSWFLLILITIINMIGNLRLTQKSYVLYSKMIRCFIIHLSMTRLLAVS